VRHSSTARRYGGSLDIDRLAQHPLLRKTPFMVIFFGEDKFREAAKRSELSGQGLFAEMNSTDPETACSALTQVPCTTRE